MDFEDEKQEERSEVATEATPDTADAVNVDVENEEEIINMTSENESGDKDLKSDGPAEIKEAPKKVELTPEEKIQHEKMVIAQQTKDTEDKLERILKELEENNYQNYVYGKDSEVTISGELFAYLVSFMATVEDHTLRVQQILGSIIDAGSSIRLGALNFRTDMTEIHGENCEKGITKSPEQVESEMAEKNIKEAPTAEARSPKARGTGDKELAEERPSAEGLEEGGSEEE